VRSEGKNPAEGASKPDDCENQIIITRHSIVREIFTEHPATWDGDETILGRLIKAAFVTLISAAAFIYLFSLRSRFPRVCFSFPPTDDV
jgi:hypothetical protein